MKVLKLNCTFTRNEKTEKIEYNIDFKSEGITDNEVKEIGEDCLRKIGEDGAGVCSSWFYYYRLSGGKYLLCSLKSEEEKYTSSAIIFTGYLPCYPVQLFGSEIFTEDSSRETGGLFSRGISGRLKPSDKINFEHASAFIKTRNDKALGYIFDFLLDDEPTGDSSTETGEKSNGDKVEKRGSSLQIRDRIENVINWMSAVEMAFPIEHSHSIYFTLEVLGNGYAVCTLTNKECNTDDLDREPRLFDFINGRIPKASSQYRFARLVEMGYMISVETLSAFHRFLEKFKYKKADGEIEECYRLFNILNFGLGNVKTEDVDSALGFALKYGAQVGLEEIFEKLEGILVNIEYEIGLGAVHGISRFMYKTALGSKERIYINKACDFYFTFTDRAVMKDEELDGEELLEFYKNIKSKALKHVETIIKWGISSARLKRITEYLEEGSFPYQAEIFLRMITSDLIKMKYSWNRAAHIQGFIEFTEACCTSLSSGTVINCSPLEAVSVDVDYFSHLALSIYNKLTTGSSKNAFVKGIVECMDKQSSAWKSEVRDAVYELEESSRLLFDEFALNISEKQNRPELFWNYFKPGQKGIPQYVRRYSEEAIKLYVSLLNEDEISSECSRLIRFIGEYDLEVDAAALKFVIREYENTLSLSQPDFETGELIKKIIRLKREERINTIPDVTGLISFGIWLGSVKRRDGLKLSEVFEECPDFKNLGNRYLEFVSWCLPKVMELADTPEYHRDIINSFYSRELDGFYNFYVGTLKQRYLDDKTEGYESIKDFLFCYFYYISPGYIYLGEADLMERIGQSIISLISENGKRFAEKLNRDLGREFASRGLSLPLMWKDMYDKSLEAIGTPIFKNVARIFNRKGE